jgi:hypothetical protein
MTAAEVVARKLFRPELYGLESALPAKEGEVFLMAEGVNVL